MSGERSIPPTSRRLREARRDGKVLKSQLFTQAAVSAVVFFTALCGARFSWVRVRHLLNCWLAEGFLDPLRCLSEAAWWGSLGAAVVLLPGAVAAVIIEGVQVGFHVEPAVLAPKLSRLEPMGGVRRLWDALAGSWQQILRAGVVALAVVPLLWRMAGEAPALMFSERAAGLSWFEGWLITIGGSGLLAMVVLAGMEILVSRRRFLRDLSMTLDEVRRELREDEGDPQMRGHRRALHEEMAQVELVRRVRRSRVIVAARRLPVTGIRRKDS